MKTFGDTLRTTRELRGLSQGALGKMLGVSQQTVAQWESNKAQPRRERKKQLMQILGTTTATAPDRQLQRDSVDPHLSTPNELAQYIPVALHPYLNREVRIGGGRIVFDYLSDRTVALVKRTGTTMTWRDLAPDILQLAVAAHLNDAQGHHKDCVLALVHTSPAPLQNMQAAMFSAGILGVTVVFTPSAQQAATLITEAEQLPA